MPLKFILSVALIAAPTIKETLWNDEAETFAARVQANKYGPKLVSEESRSWAS